MEQIVKVTKQVWKSVFKKDVDVQIEDGEVIIDQYISIVPDKVEVRHVSLLGEKVTKQDGFVVSVFKFIPATYMEPEDVDEIHVGESTSSYGAVQIAATIVLEDLCSCIFENMSYAEKV